MLSGWGSTEERSRRATLPLHKKENTESGNLAKTKAELPIFKQF